MLNKINFNKLEVLDLAVNDVKDLDFLSNIEFENLKYLYLDNNNYNDISPLLNSNLPNLEMISLNEYDSNELDDEFIELKEKENRNGYKITIHLEKPIKDQPLSKDEKPLIEERLIPKVDFLCPECGKFSPEILNIYVNNKNIELKCKICGIKKYNSKNLYKKIDNNNNIINYYIKNNKYENTIWFKEYINQKKDLIYRKNFFEFYNNNKQKFNESKEIIKKKNEQLKRISKFNDIIIDNYEKYQNNYRATFQTNNF